MITVEKACANRPASYYAFYQLAPLLTTQRILPEVALTAIFIQPVTQHLDTVHEGWLFKIE
nr:hypothetical protein B7L52_10380 [Pectobacterium carotovorum]